MGNEKISGLSNCRLTGFDSREIKSYSLKPGLLGSDKKTTAAILRETSSKMLKSVMPLRAPNSALSNELLSVTFVKFPE